MLKITLSALFLVLTWPNLVIAQPAGDAKVLVPLALKEPLPGAYGSLWTTRIALVNTGPQPITVDGYVQTNCGNACFDFRLTPPGVTFYPDLLFYSDEVQGAFLYTKQEESRFLDVELHAQDLSRQALTWGTEIPAVPESAAILEPLSLGDIPTGSTFRSRLRVYDFDPSPNRTARISYRVIAIHPATTTPFVTDGSPAETHDLPADEVLATGELTFRITTLGGGWTFHPGYAELDLSAVPMPTGVSRVRIELTPITTGLRYWAFVAVTNNETQHITTVTP